MMRRTVESKFDLVSAEYRLGRAARQAGAAQQSVTFRFRNFSVSKLFHLFFMVLVSVSKIFGIGKSIGIGVEKIWYLKKYRYRFQKVFVSQKVSLLASKKIVSIKESASVSKKFGIRVFVFGLFLSILDPKC